MFFKKEQNISYETAVLKTQPIFILGDNALAYFLTAKFQENEQTAILLTPSSPAKGYKNITINLKEEYNLQKKNISFYSTSFIHEEPLAIIISCNLNSFRAHLTLLSHLRYPNVPIICFNHIEKREQISPILGTSYHQAYFNGYLNINNSDITVCGSQPEITISEKKDSLLENILNRSNLPISFQEKDKYNFWKINSVQILGYLTTSPKQHISELLKNKEGKKLLSDVAEEISTLAKCEKIKISKEDMLKQLFEVPQNFYYQNSGITQTEKAAYIEKLYTILSEKARANNCKIPYLNYLIKKNYEKLLHK